MKARLLCGFWAIVLVCLPRTAEAVCEDQALGMEDRTIPDKQLRASSQLNSDTSAKNARLNSAQYSWCAAEDRAEVSYLEIDLGRLHVICAIATQGNSEADQWVEMYQLKTSKDIRNWTDYREGGQVRNFLGNSDRNTINKQTLFESIVASYVRVLPKAWHVLPCLRMELYGASDLTCRSTRVGVADRLIFPDYRMTATSVYDDAQNIYAPYNGRLNGNSCWQPNSKTYKEYLQLDLGGYYFVCAVETQGNAKSSLQEWTKEYQVTLSSDNVLDGFVGTFPGNEGPAEPTKNSLSSLPRAKFIRFQPTDYEKHSSLRVEVYGVLHGCRSSLGIEGGSLDDSQITAQPMNTVALNPRLYNASSGCNSSTNAGHLQVDLGRLKTVTGVAIQGDAATGPIQIGYKFGSSQLHWSKTQEIAGEVSSMGLGSVRASWFPAPIVARFIQVKAPSYPLKGGTCFRVDLYGCDNILRPRISVKSQHLPPTKGSFVDVVCEVTSQPYPVIQWWFGNMDVTSLSAVAIHSNESVNGVSVSTLRVNFTSDDDVISQYDCVRSSSNALLCTAFSCTTFYPGIKSDTLATRSAVVSVTFSMPKIVSDLKNSTVLIGSKLNLTCHVLSDSALSIYWLKDDSPDIPRAQLSNGNASLIIEALDVSDEGNYTCVVENKAGNVTSGAIVQVKVPLPQISVTQPRVLKLRYNETNITVDCKANAQTRPFVTWKKGSKAVKIVNVFSSMEYGHEVVQQQFITSQLDYWNITSRLYVRTAGITEDVAGIYTCEASQGNSNSSATETIEVLIVPQFTEQPADRVVVEGQNVSFPCEVSGVPEPSVHWNFSGGSLPKHSIGKWDLTLFAVKNMETFEGTYTCAASNRAGFSSTTASLVVDAVPKVLSLLQDVFIHVGERLELTCNVSADPAAQILWTKDNSSLPPHATLENNNSTLIVNSAAFGDDGRYTCVATNRQGNASSSSTVEVQARHRLYNLIPRSLKLKNGAINITVDCHGYGKPLPSVVWKKDGKEIRNVSEFSEAYSNQVVQVFEYAKPSQWNVTNRLYLRTVGITYEESGNYTCEVFNGVGTNYSEEQSVEVLFKPIFDVTPANQIAIEGSSVLLKCRASGVPRPRITWSFSGGALPAHNTEDGDLSINAVVNSASYEGEYTCSAESRVGKINHTATLTVHVPPQLTVILEKDVVAEEGDTVNLTCSASGDSLPIYTWIKNGLEIESVQLQNDNRSLVLRNVTSADDGFYACWAANEVGNISTTTNLTVHAIPSITQNLPFNETIISGKSVTFTCKGVSIPGPRVEWTKDDSTVKHANVDTSGNFRITSHLTINDVKYEDHGEYACVFSNYRGNVSSSVRLVVHVPVNITESPEATKKPLGAQATLNCSAHGFPIPTLTWYKQDEVVAQTVKVSINKTVDEEKLTIVTSLTFKKLERNDSGTYSCKIENVEGSYRREALLTVLEKPDLRELNIVKAGARYILLEWKVSFDGNPPIMYFLVTHNNSMGIEAHKVNRDELSYEVKNLKPATVYKLQVCAVNGQGNSCEPLETFWKTSEAAPSPPRELRVINVTTTSMLLSWKRPLELNGVLRMYVVTISNARSINITQHLERATIFFNVTSLQPFTLYHVRVAGWTVMQGQYSDAVSKLTDESTPGPPYDVSQEKLGDKYHFTWKTPEQPRGVILKYEIDLNVVGKGSNKSFHTKDNSTSFKVYLNELNGDKKYHVIITGRTIKGLGEPSTGKLTVETPVTNPPIPQSNLSHNETKSATVVIYIPKFSDENGEILFYRIMVTRIPNQAAKKSRYILPKETVSYEDAHKADEAATYVAFQFKGSNYQKYQRFTVGDEKRSDANQRDRRQVGEYYNGPLHPLTEYLIYVRAFTSEITYSDTTFTGFKTDSGKNVRVQTAAGRPPQTWLPMFLSIIAMFLILSCVIIVFSIIKRRRADKNVSVRDLTGLDVTEMQSLRDKKAKKEPNGDVSDDLSDDFSVEEADEAEKSLSPAKLSVV